MAIAPNSSGVEAHDATVALISTIPDAALTWQPGQDDWSLRQIIEHLSGSGGFFSYLVHAAQASDFGKVAMNREELGKYRAADREAISKAHTTIELLAHFERSWITAQEVISRIPEADLDRPFELQSFGNPGAFDTVTLRTRVVEQIGRHLTDHEAQIRTTLERWKMAPAKGNEGLT